MAKNMKHGDSSSRRVQANRLNAQKSTGPKDTTKTRQNAVSHGLLASGRTVLDGEEYDAILLELSRQLNPVGILEETEVKRLALLTVRLRRTKSVEDSYFAHVREKEKRLSTGNRGNTIELMKYLAGNDAKAARDELKTLLERIMSLATNAEEGDNEPSAIRYFTALLPWVLGAPFPAVPVTTSTVEFRSSSTADPTQRKIIVALEEFVRLLDSNPELVAEGDDAKQSIFEMKRLLPDAVGPAEISPAGHPADINSVAMTDDVLDGMIRLQRYETALENQYSKVLNRLERLQRLRSGEFLPAPVVFDVSVHDERLSE